MIKWKIGDGSNQTELISEGGGIPFNVGKCIIWNIRSRNFVFLYSYIFFGETLLFVPNNLLHKIRIRRGRKRGKGREVRGMICHFYSKT